MSSVIKVSTTSTDKTKIKTIKEWIRKSNVSHDNRLMSPILVPENITLTPEEVSAYASAINSIFPDERVSDYSHNIFITVKKEVFPKVCFHNDFYQDYYMEEYEDGWYIIPTSLATKKREVF
ncbi:MAG: hypothetical protein IJY81_06320 [Lachnospiraceae bacterium]|nr:hypothetical protein [Lachnospiraceae bacterium]